MRKVVATLVTLSLTGCATTFQEPPPDFTKTNAEARAEIERYHVDWMNSHVATIRRKSYHMDSLRPIVRDVSPAADRTLEKSRFWSNMGWAFIGAAIVTLGQPRESWTRHTGYWILLGLSIGSSTYGNHLGGRAAREFNQDFEAKFEAF